MTVCVDIVFLTHPNSLCIVVLCWCDMAVCMVIVFLTPPNSLCTVVFCECDMTVYMISGRCVQVPNGQLRTPAELGAVPGHQHRKKCAPWAVCWVVGLCVWWWCPQKHLMVGTLTPGGWRERACASRCASPHSESAKGGFPWLLGLPTHFTTLRWALGSPTYFFCYSHSLELVRPLARVSPTCDVDLICPQHAFPPCLSSAQTRPPSITTSVKIACARWLFLKSSCVCVCACVRACVRAHACMCVRVRGRERLREFGGFPGKAVPWWR